MDYIVYILMRVFVTLFAIIPFPLVYLFSDFVFLFVYYFPGYRRRVVEENIRNSFPHMSREEQKRIARGFYHHLCDLLVESLKAFTVSEKKLCKRYRYDGMENIDQFAREGRNVIVVGGHYGNWEWTGIVSGNQMLHKPVGFYKPLSNRYIDQYMKRTRVRGRSILASINKTSEVFTTDYHEPAAFYMVADQSPSSPRLAYWMTFLNQETAVLHGPEKYARLHNLPVVYTNITKISRGHYSACFELLAENPKSMKMGTLTSVFMQRLEENIRQNPSLYLWSHRRWKLKRNQ